MLINSAKREAGINPESIIEYAKLSDLEEITTLLRKENLPCDDLTENHLDSFFIIRSDQSIIAIVGSEIYNTSALLRSLVVHVTYRDRNLGNHLLEYLESYLHKKKIESIYLLTTTAVEYFVKHKYRVINRNNIPKEILSTEEFTNLCPDSALCMTKSL